MLKCYECVADDDDEDDDEDDDDDADDEDESIDGGSERAKELVSGAAAVFCSTKHFLAKTYHGGQQCFIQGFASRALRNLANSASCLPIFSKKAAAMTLRPLIFVSVMYKNPESGIRTHIQIHTRNQPYVPGNS